MDDTTDNYTPNNDQGKVRIAKLFPGDIDNDGNGDIVFSSGSFASDKPQLFMVEYEEQSLSIQDNKTTIKNFRLNQNYPNPFNPTTKFEYFLNNDGEIEISIYDVTGRQIRELYKGFQSSGSYEVSWNGKDKHHKLVSNGVYLYQLKMGSKSGLRKMIFMK